jgi:ATP adenylyltransferase
MMIVPRAEERFGTVSVNALAFVGSLFVKHREELDRVLAHGPLAVLAEVALPP